MKFSPVVTKTSVKSMVSYGSMFICRHTIRLKLKVGWQKLHSFGFAKGRLAGGAKPNVCNAGWLKEILKNAKGWLFLSFPSPVPIAKHGQLESLSAWPICSVC